jgi:UDP-glucose 4-epimerase
MLGQSVSRLPDLTEPFVGNAIDWRSADAVATIAAQTQLFLDHAGSRPWRVVWCAGAGVIGTDQAELEHETAILRSLLDALRDRPDGTVFLASSAGGVYGGTRDIPITEGSRTLPLSDYGWNKLTQEQLVRTWAAESGGRGVIGRVANLYGPGQRLSKPQGLITQICLATLLRRPVSVYVSLDTLRDYIYVDDCSRMIGDCLDAAETLEAGITETKILATGSSVSIGALLAQARRVLGRAPAVVMIRSGRTAQQGNALTFRSTVWPDASDLVLTPLPVGIHRTSEYLRSQLQLGTLL